MLDAIRGCVTRRILSPPEAPAAAASPGPSGVADGELATHETWLVRKLARLLDLEPGYLAEARRSAATREPRSAEESP